jgi:lipopolysaccharide/colanic/teichoic acid biosynthesis glycosyltransferase
MTIHFEQRDATQQLQGEINAAYFLPVQAAGTIGLLPINHAMKRLFDVIVSVSLLLVLSPLLLLLGLAVAADGGPAMFRHHRVGRAGRAFGCLKFRSMSVTAEQDLVAHLAANPAAAAEWAAQRKLQHDPRITRLGAVLRATSFDELPQLLNVLRGEMSLIGPRPVVYEELEEYYCAIGRRAYAATPPGITGLWQVSGRSGTSYAERVRLDIAYVNGWSLRQDMLILLRTIPAVLRRKGAV